jgi:hypothetical protein
VIESVWRHLPKARERGANERRTDVTSRLYSRCYWLAALIGAVDHTEKKIYTNAAGGLLMPVFNVAEWDDDTDERFLRPPARCFLCGRILSDDVLIYWLGCRPDHHAQDSPQIWMHADCALHLSRALAQDVVQARSSSPSRP